MTRRERVRKTIRHEQPDKVPWTFPFAGPALAKLADHYDDMRLTDNQFFDEWAGNHFRSVGPRGKGQVHGLEEEIEPGLCRYLNMAETRRAQTGGVKHGSLDLLMERGVEMMTPRERVEAILLHGDADQVPFTVYECMLPQCEAERRLRNEGLCIVNRFGVFKTETPDVMEKICGYREDGVLKERRDIQTPHGDLFSISAFVDIDAPSGTTTWDEQKIFKSPEDYRAIEFMIRNRVHIPDYEPFLKAQEAAGGDIIYRTGIGYEPLQEIIISIMGLETFAIEWAINRDEVLKLYQALVEDRRKIYPMVAQSPALHANYGGNVVPEIVGLQRFEKYILPDYQECAEVMHKHGKLVGTHLDGNTKLIAPLVAESGLDYIEAFTPSPDTDMSVEEALDIWPDKVLWMNFPSSVHLQELESIEKTMLEILEQSKPGNRLIVGITEDVPEDRWRDTFLVISQVLTTRGRLPLS